MDATPTAPAAPSAPGQSRLLLFIVGGALLGGLIGWLAPGAGAALGLLGELFLLLLRMLVVPLVVASMITGVASLGDIRRLGRTGYLTLGYYAVTTALALIAGLFLVNLIAPGAGLALPEALAVPEKVAGKEGIGAADMLKGLFTDNLFRSAAETELLPLILFSLAFGGVLTTLGEKGRPVLAFFEGVDAAMMRLVHLVMYTAPLGVMGLVSGRLAAAGGGEGFLRLLVGLGKYVFTVVAGLGVHAALVLPLILFLVARRSPLAYLRGMGTALTTAFSTASSSATLPLTLEAVEENNRVPPEAARFVIPLGATVNMDGTALYEAVAALFIAQAFGIELGPQAQLIVFLTATLASIGAAGIPEAGTVTMVIVLNAVGLPLEGVGLILSIDWLLDRCRTTVNVWGDAVGAAVVARLSGAGGAPTEP